MLHPALKSVFGGAMGMPSSGVNLFPNLPLFPNIPLAWPIFSLAAPTRANPPDADLAQMVESQIIPRLVQAHESSRPESPVADHASESGAVLDDIRTDAIILGAETTRLFAEMVVSNVPGALSKFVAALLEQGILMASVYDDLLAPTAGLLADLWDDDKLSYTEVTIAMGRLQQLIRGLAWRTPYNGDDDPASPSVLFAPRPGEKQTFGFYMMEEFFRWSGWRAWIDTATKSEEIISTVRSQWFDMFCMNVSRDADMPGVTAMVQALRKASQNPDLFILMSGGPFTEHPERVAMVGADAAAASGGEALHIMEKTVSRRATA